MRSRHGAPLLLRLGFLGLGLLGLGLLGLGLLGLGLLLLGLPGQFALRRRRARARARPGAAAAAAAAAGAAAAAPAVPCPTAGGPRARAPPAATAATAYVALACAALGSSLLHDPHDRSLAAPVSEVGVIQSPDGVQHGLVVGELYNPHERTATVPLDVEEVVRVQIPNPGAHEILQGLPRGAGRDALHKHPVLRALAPRSPTGASRTRRARPVALGGRATLGHLHPQVHVPETEAVAGPAGLLRGPGVVELDEGEDAPPPAHVPRALLRDVDVPDPAEGPEDVLQLARVHVRREPPP